MTQTLNINLPETIYQQLLEIAHTTQESLESVIVQSIRVGLPPDLSKVPERFRTDLRTLNSLDNAVLRRVAQAELDTAKSEQYESLLLKNQQEVLSDKEQSQLDQLREEADLLMLRRAYSYALLKWRGEIN